MRMTKLSADVVELSANIGQMFLLKTPAEFAED